MDAQLIRAGCGLVVGAIAGSFLSTVLIRWPESRSILRGRSACDGCGRVLRSGELIPILSFVAVKGRCRSCDASIAPEHLGLEVAGGLVGAVALSAHPGWAGMVTALFGWWLLILGALDARHQWLPDRLTLPLAPAGLAVAVAGIGPDWRERVIGAVAGFVLLSGIATLYQMVRRRKGLGGGDPKLLAGLGAWVGWQQLPFVLLGAGLLGLVAILMKRARGEKVRAVDRLPLGTLMALAAWPLWLLLVGRVTLTS